MDVVVGIVEPSGVDGPCFSRISSAGPEMVRVEYRNEGKGHLCINSVEVKAQRNSACSVFGIFDDLVFIFPRLATIVARKRILATRSLHDDCLQSVVAHSST